MKNHILSALSVVCFCALGLAQVSISGNGVTIGTGAGVTYFAGTPSGSCSPTGGLALDQATGGVYWCNAGSWASILAAGGISGTLSTGFLPIAGSSSSLTNSPIDYGVTTTDTVTINDTGGETWPTVVFANLPITPPPGTVVNCSDCNPTCTASTNTGSLPGTPQAVTGQACAFENGVWGGLINGANGSGGGSAKTFPNIDQSLTNWSLCYIGACNGGSPGGNVAPASHVFALVNGAPCMDSTCLELSETSISSGSGNQTNILATYKSHDSATQAAAIIQQSFTVSLYNPGNWGNASALELDQFIFSDSSHLNTEFMFGTQCNAGFWDIFNQNNGHWITTAVACALLTNATGWHTITQNVHRIAGDTNSCNNTGYVGPGSGTQPCEYYDSIIVDGTQSSFGAASPQPAGTQPAGWASDTGFQFQIDIAGNSKTVTEYLDLASYTEYTAGTSGLSDPGANGLVYRTSLNLTRPAVFGDVVNLWASGGCTAYLFYDGTCSTPSGTFPSGLTGQVAAYAANGSAGTAVYLPSIDVRPFFTHPYPTIAQAQAQDFGAVLGAALTFAGGSACVDLNGIAQTLGQNGKLGMTTNPFVNQAGGSAPCIKGGNGLVIIFGAALETPNGPMEVDGFPSAASANPRGLIFTPCNNSGGCTIGSGITVPQYTTSATCVASGGVNCWPTGSPTSAALVTYSTGTITIGNSSTGCSGTNLCVTGSGTAFTTGSPNNVLPGAILVASCGGACTPGSTSAWVTGRVVAVNSATSLTLEAAWTGTTASQQYIVYNPNTSVLICDGCNGAAYGVNTFGHIWRNVFVDMAGVGGAIGYLAHSCQEGCEYDNFRIGMQANVGGTPTGTAMVGACAMWDATLRGASVSGGSSESPIGVGQYSAVNISNCAALNETNDQLSSNAPYTLTQVTVSGGSTTYTGTITGCGSNACAGGILSVNGFAASSGVNNGVGMTVTSSTTTTLVVATTDQINETHAGIGLAGSNGWEFEGYSVMDGKILGGPNAFMLGSVVGTPANHLNDCVWIDGNEHGTYYGHHCESVSNDDIEVGQSHPVYGINILDAFSANTNSNAVVEFHTGTSGNIAHAISRLKTSGCLVEDDNLATPCTQTASGGTPLSLVENFYAQNGNSGNSIVTGGGIVANGPLIQPGVSFSSLPGAPTVGTVQFCTNCIPTTAATCSTNSPASCVCTSGTGSMWAKYENFVNNGAGWYCH